MMEFLENKKGTIMIPDLKQYIEKKFKEDSPSKNHVQVSQDYLLEWEQEKQKKQILKISTPRGLSAARKPESEHFYAPELELGVR